MAVLAFPAAHPTCPVVVPTRQAISVQAQGAGRVDPAALDLPAAVLLASAAVVLPAWAVVVLADTACPVAAAGGETAAAWLSRRESRARPPLHLQRAE